MKFSFQHKQSNTQGTALKRGSALLIVLGFLSFMMVSAVSFAIYMRIERQASSNYRHAVTARHLLNASLYRAIDEIDSELRLQQLNGSDQPVKFPDWPGRTKPSAVPNGLDNGQEARVLSLEALSFIPGIFVNDVRRYAVTNQYDTVGGLTPKHRSYLGTKWRTLSMPVSSFGDVSKNAAPNAYEEAVVGRYAYLCVNVSDLLDVNLCKAGPRDALTNHVGLAHLFYDNNNPPNHWEKTARKNFDSYVENTGRRFETLQDFYACMYKNPSGTIFGSPYHEYLSTPPNSNPKPDDVFDDAYNHILVTDSFAKPQPASAKACNIYLQQPISQSALNTRQTASVSLEDQMVQGRNGFKTALENMFAGRLLGGANLNDCFPIMLADYIDEDNYPKTLNMPTVEIVPMISQLLVPQFFAPALKSRSDGGTPPITTYFLDLNPGARARLSVEVAWPYKHLKDRTCPPSTAYSVEITAYMTVHKLHEPKNSESVATTINDCQVTLTGTEAVPDFSGKDDDDQNACFQTVEIPLTATGNTQMDIFASDGTDFRPLEPGFSQGTPFSVSLIVFARVKRGTVYVDSAPQVLPLVQSPDRDFLVCRKLFFQTNKSAPLAPVMDTGVGGQGKALDWEWRSLEAPDPRFNHKTANWLLVNEPTASIPPKMSDVTSTQLLGKDGRDGDIFMTTSDAGKLVSPGELGFILRPFSFDPRGEPVDFRTRTALDPTTAKDDSDAYFRTIRLYDHDPANPADKITKAQDPVYDNFVVQAEDGSAPGSRVTPLSESPVVLAAAVEQTPVDYWFATRDVKADRTIMMDNTFNTLLGTSDWPKFRKAWLNCLTNCVKKTASTGQLIRNSWQHGLPEYYGNYDKFGWYSAGVPDEIFASGTPASLSTPLHEIDRKMLYAFSLDSFSDRQQLFLYILRAEVTVPSFGSSQESGTKSLAGGRAVAVVWRDPYPEGYDRANNSWPQNNWFTTPKRISPWYQVNRKQYNEDHEAYDDDNVNRYRSYHDYRILYFKQLSD